MVICKFFLQGNCKFGDFCKFEHQISDNFNNYQNSSSILRQSQFGNTQQQPKPVANPTNVDTTTLVKSVVNDMMVAEKGGQWLLSCYAPFKEKPAFPGFEDHSFEEIRLGYYEAVKNGTVEQYKQQIQIMLQQAVMRIKSLQSPSPDIVNLLKCIYNTPPSSHCGVYGSNTNNPTTTFGNIPNTSGAFGPQQPSTFGQQSSTSIYPQSNQNNIFGKSAQPQNQFSGGMSNNIFGGSATQTPGGQTGNSIFGNIQAQGQSSSNTIFQQANSNFGTPGSGSMFVGQPTTPQASTGSIFGGGKPAGGSIFGGQQTSVSSGFTGQQNAASTYGPQQQIQQTSGNVFGSTFTAPNPKSAFGGQNPSFFGTSPTFAPASSPPNMPQQSSTNIFQMGASQPQIQTAQSSMFSQQQQPSMFAQQNVGSVFNQQSASTPFAQPSSNVTDAKSHSNSIFGSSQNTIASNSAFGQVQPVDETIYSKLEELTEEDINWFETDDLDVLKMPEKPPTYQMCFKT